MGRSLMPCADSSGGTPRAPSAGTATPPRGGGAATRGNSNPAAATGADAATPTSSPTNGFHRERSCALSSSASLDPIQVGHHGVIRSIGRALRRLPAGTIQCANETAEHRCVHRRSPPPVSVDSWSVSTDPTRRHRARPDLPTHDTDDYARNPDLFDTADQCATRETRCGQDVGTASGNASRTRSKNAIPAGQT